MIQILGFVSDTWNSISFSIINGVFGLVAKTYDMLLQIINRDQKLLTDYFVQFTTIMYVLAGVFMLFKIAISLVQMLINPDQINDKQAGAGKIITRVITSIIMLMAFAPNGILFGENGLFAEVEDGLLASDGIISQLMNLNLEESSETSKNIGSEMLSNISSTNPLIEDVQATTQLTCYYINVREHTRKQENGNMTNTMKLGNVFKVEFFSDGSGKKKISGTDYSYTIRNDQKIAGKDEYGKYADFTMNISAGNVFNGSKFPSSCPKYFKKNAKSWSAQKKHPSGMNDILNCQTVATSTFPQTCSNKGVMLAGEGNNNAGFKQMDDMVNKKKLSASGQTALYSIITNNKYLAAKTNTSANDKEANKEYLNNLAYADTSLPFAQGVAGSLQECVTEKRDECTAAQKEMFKTVDGNKKIKDLMNNDDLDVSFIASIITGIGLIVYLIFLCIEVLVRRLKLYLLEMIAPLPIVCYINPKDKIFNQWFKMYMSTYADLFIKLVAISMAVNLFSATMNDFWSTDGTMVKFFYIIAILVFAKVVPTMISKIFGLDSMGGSFKEIAGLGKKAAMAGVGAAALGAVGLASGGIGGLAKGLAMGAGAGWGNKIGEGMKNLTASNYKTQQMKDDGLNFWQRAQAGLYTKTGIRPSGKKAAEQMKLADSAIEGVEKLKKHGVDELNKKGALISVGAVSKNEKGEAVPIKDKNGKFDVTTKDEVIDWKKEKIRQSNLAGLSVSDWDSMDDVTKVNTFGEMAAFTSDGNRRTLDDAQSFQNERIAALEDYGVAERLNTNIANNDQTTIKIVSQAQQSISEAKAAGVNVVNIPSGATYNNKTIKTSKDSGTSAYNSIEAQNAEALKIQKYIGDK